MPAELTLSRRHLLRDLGAILCAPAIVRVSAIMPVRAMPVQLDINTLVAAEGWMGNWHVVGWAGGKKIEYIVAIPANQTVVLPVSMSRVESIVMASATP